MLDIIKSLSPKQRLTAFIFTTVISAIVSISTIYLKTDDCSGISDQYTKLVENQTKLMGVNNDLITQYNQARTDLVAVNGYLKTIDSLSKIQYTNTETVTTTYVPVVKNQVKYVYVDSTHPPVHMSALEREPVIPQPKTEVKHNVVKAPIKLGGILDSLNTITSKYKKKN
jgi:hypothetical protein